LARKILLADDSVTAQNMGRKILADAGYEVITVNNGSAALKKIGEQRPDVIVLDVYMPGYSGLEVCQRLKEAADTARIPILLTVGKLEPFKPEEAKRVRADAFIVKPFEASELLSALSRLEDKIVPRNEPSKPGRFARAVEDSRFDKTMAVEEDSGWKNRIAFPTKKKEKEKEPEFEEAVVPIASRNSRTEFREMAVEAPAGQKSEETVDVGALANAGLPKDVTPEEIAALAAAAARIKGKIAEPNREEPVSEIPVSAAVQAASLEAPASPLEVYGADAATEVLSEGKESEPKAAAESEQASSAVAHSQETPRENTPEEQNVTAAVGPSSQEALETAGEPVTMAAAAAVGESVSQASRWTAVSVALAPEETGISLEQEMQKAYAEFAAAETGHTASITADSVHSSERAPASAPLPATVAPEALQDLSAVGSAAAEVVTAGVKELEEVASAYAASAPESVIESAAHAEKTIVEAAAAAVLESPAALHGDPSEPVKPVQESVSSQEAALHSAAQSETAGESVSAKPVAESSEPLAAKASAAIVETPAQDTAAMAAAVGGEPVEESSYDNDPAIASIVDSVLANLRPKIVEEISRKLGRK
jgi:CheY-like chemotaxis protein